MVIMKVSLQILLAISYAKIQDDTEATFSAEGSPKPSIAAQSPTPEQPIREQEDGRRRIAGKNQKLYLYQYTDISKVRSRSTRLSSSFADTNV
jgi:hypothetical protein